jgi:DNA-binding NtrC family response regulator
MKHSKHILIISDPGTNALLSGLTAMPANMEAFFADNEEKAIEMANNQHFDMAVIDNTNNDIDVKKLSVVLPILLSDIELVHYEGESLQELKAKMLEVFDYQKSQRIKRFIVLDSSNKEDFKDLPPFSAN